MRVPLDGEAAGCPPSGGRPGEGEVVARGRAGDVVRRYDGTPPHSKLEGDVLASCLYAGAGVGKMTGVQSAEALVKELWREATACLGRRDGG